MKKISSIILYVLLAVSVISIVMVMVRGEAALDFILRWAYVLLGIAIATAVLFPVVNLAQNPKGAIRSLVGLGAVAVVVLIAYIMSSSEPIVTAVATYDNPFDLKLTDTLLFTAYIALAATIIAAVVSEIRNSLM